MNIPWTPVVVVDIVGSVLTLLIAIICANLAWQWARNKTTDNFRQYILLLTLAIVFFAVSRSFGHLIKQILLLSDLARLWKNIAPFSGAVNSTAFVVIFSFSVYFHRFQRVHKELDAHRNNLEMLVAERTAELEEKNESLAEEISERQKTANSLRQSKATLENILNSSNPLCITKFDYEILVANEAYYKIWSKTAANGLKCYDSRPGPVCHTDDCPLHQIMQGKEEVRFDTVKYDVQGTKMHFFLTAKPFRDADGKIVGIIEGFTDITLRKRAQEALAAEKEQLSVTLRSIGDGVITTDTQGKIILLNKVAEDLTGWNQNEAVGRPLEEIFNIIDGVTRKSCESPAQRVLALGGIVELAGHTILIARDGNERHVADSAAPIRDRESCIVGSVVVFRDVTAKNRMEAELLKAKKIESVGVLAGGIAHDFNNILVAILGNINLVRQIIPPEDEVQSMLAEAEKASLRAKGLTQQLLTFSKGGAPVIETAAIAEIIKESADFVLHGGKVSCRYNIPEDLWLTAIDKGQMSQAKSRSSKVSM